MPIPSLDLYVIKHAVINDASSGDNEIVAAVARDKEIASKSGGTEAERTKQDGTRMM